MIASAASTTAASTSSVDERILQGSSDLDESAQLCEIARAGGRGFRRGELIEDLLDFVILEREYQAIGVGKAELDPVGGVQLLSRYFDTVDEYAVAAFQILHEILADFLNYARVIARGAIVAQDQVIVRLDGRSQRERVIMAPASACRKDLPPPGSPSGAGRPRRPVLLPSGTPGRAGPPLSFDSLRLRFLHLVRSQRLAMRAVSADLCSRKDDLKPEMRFHLLAKLL